MTASLEQMAFVIILGSELLFCYGTRISARITSLLTIFSLIGFVVFNQFTNLNA